MHESFTLSLTGNSTVLAANYFPSLNVYEDSEIALLSLQTFNSFPNIIDAFNNRLKIEVIPSKRNKYKSHIFAFCLKEGCYEIEDINNKIVKELSQVNNKYRTQLTFSVRIDPVDFRTYIKCNGILQFNTQYKVVDNDNAPIMCYIKLEEGCYEIEDINQRVKKQIDVYNSENLTNITYDISVDPNDFRSYIKCNGVLHFEIPFSIAPVLGFEKRQYKPEYEILRSEKAANLNTINSIKVMCNIAQGSFNNHLQSHSIYEFFPSGRTGSKVIQSPPNLIYYKLNKTNIDSITIQLVDQDHNPINNLEGQVSDAGKVKLTNNGFSYLFEQIRLEINGIEVDSTRVLGITSSLKGYLSGLFEDFKKILVHSRLELILTRCHSDLNALKVITSGSTNSGKVVLNKIVWKVPHITVDDEERLKILKLIEKEKSLFIPFRSFETFEYPELGTTKKVVWNLKSASKLEKPRFIIIGLQKERKNSLEKDYSVFDHCNITNVKVFLNSIAYPYDNLDLDFAKNNFTLLYDMYTSFQESYYEKSIRNPILSPSTFLTHAPIIVIDTSKQNDSATASSVDVQLEIEASESLSGVTAYCLLIHDRIVEYVPFTREVRKLV
ncbi:hypothetical protein AGLY_011996 [Aphis glycines]|uniref:Double jelly roll-like domain-containing protein n=1 Tax=Aphis glycines TaxID=307491 RepID=A0A6G0TAG5_APHGL|nr:hypothetical protein AGLY_011996 [Aphis glycines]